MLDLEVLGLRAAESCLGSKYFKEGKSLHPNHVLLNLVPTAKALVALFTRLGEDASGTGEAKAMLAKAKMAEVENFMMS